MTSVPPTQPPAAPETDVGLTEAERRGLFTAAKAEWLPPMGRDPLEAAVERIVAERVRVVEGERDVLRAVAAVTPCACSAQRARAESAEAAHRALQAAVEALAVEWEADQGRTWIASLADDLRALLAGGAR